MISFLDTTTFENPSSMESIPFAPEIQNILDLVIFRFRKKNHEFLHLKLVMRSILPTDQKELVSFGCLQKEQKKTNFLEVFSKIQMIIF
jgi:hypothetical protein